MYQALSLLTGLVLSVMIAINGGLTQLYGAYPATAIIHAVGVVFAFFLLLLRKKRKPILGQGPAWIYLGGVIGVATALFNNLSFGHISLTSIIALGLLGQTLTSLAVDMFGLFGTPRRPFQKTTLIGLAFSLAGIVLMLDPSVTRAMAAVGLSLLAGVSVVVSRTVNARLSEKTDALIGSFVNHLAGLPVALVLALLFSGAPAATAPPGAAPLWIYLGGTLGVTVVWLSNFTVPKVPAFRLTVLVFLGQVFTGLLLDIASGRGALDASFWGGLIIALGVLLNILAEHAAHAKAPSSKGR